MVNNPTCPLGSSKRTAAECGTEASTQQTLRGTMETPQGGSMTLTNETNRETNWKVIGFFGFKLLWRFFCKQGYWVNSLFSFLGGGKIHKVDCLVVEMVYIYIYFFFCLNFRVPFSSHKSWILCDVHIHDYLRSNGFRKDSKLYRSWLIGVTAEDKTHHYLMDVV